VKKLAYGDDEGDGKPAALPASTDSQSDDTAEASKVAGFTGISGDGFVFNSTKAALPFTFKTDEEGSSGGAFASTRTSRKQSPLLAPFQLPPIKASSEKRILGMGNDEAGYRHDSWEQYQDDHEPMEPRKVATFRDSTLQVETGFESSWIVDLHGDVYTWGGLEATLGREVSDEEPDSSLQLTHLTHFVGAPAGKTKIRKITANGGMALLLDHDGLVFFAGSISSADGTMYRPGHDIVGSNTVPCLVTLDGPAKDIFVGGSFCAVLMESGHLVTFGTFLVFSLPLVDSSCCNCLLTSCFPCSGLQV